MPDNDLALLTQNMASLTDSAPLNDGGTPITDPATVQPLLTLPHT